MITERQRYGSRGQGSLIKYDDSPNWFSCYYVRGTEHRESTGTPDLKLARRFHRRKLDEVAGDRQGLKKYLAPMAQRVQLGELLDTLEADYRLRSVKSSAQVQSHLKPIRAHFGDWRAVDITAEAVDAYIEARLDADKARATINRETQLLGQALRLAFERHRITTIPSIRHLPESNARQGFFEAAEFEVLVAALPEYLQDFARFAYLTGWRRGEILSLQWADVDLKAGAIRLRSEHSKNGHGRVVMLGGDLETLMQRRAKARLTVTRDGEAMVCDRVFHRAGEPIGDFRKAWTTACVAAGLYHVVLTDTMGSEKKIPEKLFHDLRRTAARNMIRNGVPERVAMAVTGHLTRSMFDRYNITSEDDLRAAMQKVALPPAVPTERGENAESKVL
jgi:integrase